ncbi:MAG TPA: hypothetical protein VFN97_23370, partial [Actinospica sp.]|nr:hypothetical protein [Actinospica sp.]
RGDRLARLALDVYSMLEPEQRELLDLAFRHRLVDADLALVLHKDESGISVEVTRAQADLETALLVVLAARTGDPRCEEAAEFGRRFDEIDGKGIPAWLSGASKHVEGCGICGDAIRNRRPLRLFEELPHAFMPPGVRSRVLEALRDPAGAAFAEQIVERSGKFAENGFPAGGGGAGFGSMKKWVFPSAGLAAALACAVALVMFMTNDHPAASADVTTTASVTSGGATGATSTFGELTASASLTSASASASKSASASASTSSAAAATTTSAAGQQTTCVTYTTSVAEPTTVTSTSLKPVISYSPTTTSASPTDIISSVPYTHTATVTTTKTTTYPSPVTTRSCN